MDLIKEMAVEPEVMARWEWFLKIYDDAGLEKGRLISQFPKKWKRAVKKRALELIDEGVNQTMKSHSLIDRLDRDDFDDKLLDSDRSYDVVSGTWLERALAQSEPFDVILAMDSDLSPGYIRAKDFFWEDARYKVELQSDQIKRKADSLIAPCKRLLAKSSKLKVIEPYFCPIDELRKRPFIKLIDMISDFGFGIPEVELHTKRGNFSSATVRNYQKHIAPEIPSGITVKVFFWEQEDNGENLHPRFVLTDKGGLQFDYGFDESQNGNETTIVSILGSDFSSRIWDRYEISSGTFDIDETQHVITLV